MCPGILIISEAKISWVEAKMLRIEAKSHIVGLFQGDQTRGPMQKHHINKTSYLFLIGLI